MEMETRLVRLCFRINRWPDCEGPDELVVLVCKGTRCWINRNTMKDTVCVCVVTVSVTECVDMANIVVSFLHLSKHRGWPLHSHSPSEVSNYYSCKCFFHYHISCFFISIFLQIWMCVYMNTHILDAIFTYTYIPPLPVF